IKRPDQGTFHRYIADAGPNVDAFGMWGGKAYLSFNVDAVVGANQLDVTDDTVFALSGTDLAASTATSVLDSHQVLLGLEAQGITVTDIDAFSMTATGEMFFSTTGSHSFLREGGNPLNTRDYITRDGGVIYHFNPASPESFDPREESSIYFDASATFGTSVNIDALHVVAELHVEADFNRDGHVDASDYVVWRNALGATGLVPYAPGDADGNGRVDHLDYQWWKANFGTSSAGLALTVSQRVPEPSSLVLFALGSMGFSARRKRQRAFWPRP